MAEDEELSGPYEGPAERGAPRWYEWREWMANLSRALAAAPAPIRSGLAGYSVVALFGLAYAVTSLLWRGAAPTAVAVAAALVAAPLALALLWPRLAGVKAFGFEVTLAQVTVPTYPGLVSVITMQQYTSGLEHLVNQLRNAIARPDIEMIEVNFRDGGYWWPTRLYLLAALAEDYTTVGSLAFVSGKFERVFVGISSPATVRRALVHAFPAFESFYRQATAGVRPLPMIGDQLANIVNSFAGNYAASSGTVGEDQLERVSKELLQQWLEAVGRPLATDSVAWTGVSDIHLYRSLVVDHTEPYVALLRDGRLDRMINRLELAIRLVARGA